MPPNVATRPWGRYKSVVVSFVDRFSSLLMFKNYRETKFWDLELCPL